MSSVKTPRLRRRRTAKKPMKPMSHTVYHSTQYNSTMVNGRQVATEKTVDIRNGKGIITVKKMADGNTLASTTHKISRENMKDIVNNKLVPRLFARCIRCNTRKMEKHANINK